VWSGRDCLGRRLFTVTSSIVYNCKPVSYLCLYLRVLIAVTGSHTERRCRLVFRLSVKERCTSIKSVWTSLLPCNLYGSSKASALGMQMTASAVVGLSKKSCDKETGYLQWDLWSAKNGSWTCSRFHFAPTFCDYQFLILFAWWKALDICVNLRPACSFYNS